MKDIGSITNIMEKGEKSILMEAIMLEAGKMEKDMERDHIENKA